MYVDSSCQLSRVAHRLQEDKTVWITSADCIIHAQTVYGILRLALICLTYMKCTYCGKYDKMITGVTVDTPKEPSSRSPSVIGSPAIKGVVYDWEYFPGVITKHVIVEWWENNAWIRELINVGGRAGSLIAYWLLTGDGLSLSPVAFILICRLTLTQTWGVTVTTETFLTFYPNYTENCDEPIFKVHDPTL